MSPPGANSGESDNRYTFFYRSDEDNQPVMTVIEAVAWIKGVDALELEPLYDTVNVDDIYGLFSRNHPGVLYRSTTDSATANQELSFDYEGCRVTVNPNEVQIELE